ncbi:hypothetical protein CPB85DRAFT_103238, partial [Mucidula mucida]
RTSQHQVPSQIKLRLLLLQRGAHCSYITFSSVPLSTPTYHVHRLRAHRSPRPRIDTPRHRRAHRNVGYKRSHAHSPLRRLHPPRLRPALHCHHPPGPISLRLLRRPHRQRHPPCPHLPPITPGRVCPGPPVLFLLPVQIRYAASPEPLCYARNLGRQRVGVEDLASVGRLARSRSRSFGGGQCSGRIHISDDPRASEGLLSV